MKSVGTCSFVADPMSEEFKGAGICWQRTAFPDLLELMEGERLQLSSCRVWLNAGSYRSQPTEEETQED